MRANEAPLPQSCPVCQSNRVKEVGIRFQYQTEIPRQPIQRRFAVHIGECEECGTRVQGRHARQTSDALGAAAAQLGPQGHGALSLLNKELGLSHGKCAQVFAQLFGITIARSTPVRSILRTARRCQPAYRQIRELARASPFNACDETSWRLAGENSWLHVAVSAVVTCYVIAVSRGHGPLAQVVGEGYAGTLIHDGWRAYDRFGQAVHQQCLAHLLRRCKGLLETAVGGAVRFPRAVRAILQGALQVRDRALAGEVSVQGLAVRRGRLRAHLRRLITPRKQNVANERLAAHLERHLDEVFTFLEYPGLDATNWRAEQAIRPAVVNRKVWGGNRTDHGAEAQSILMSVIVTCHQNAIAPLEFISQVLCSPRPALLFGEVR